MAVDKANETMEQTAKCVPTMIHQKKTKKKKNNPDSYQINEEEISAQNKRAFHQNYTLQTEIMMISFLFFPEKIIVFIIFFIDCGEQQQQRRQREQQKPILPKIKIRIIIINIREQKTSNFYCL